MMYTERWEVALRDGEVIGVTLLRDCSDEALARQGKRAFNRVLNSDWVLVNATDELDAVNAVTNWLKTGGEYVL